LNADTHTPTPAQRAEEFLTTATQFRLGSLLTETPHPRSETLSQTAKQDVPAALGMLFDVDRDVVEKYRQWSVSGQPERVSRELAAALLRGGRVFCTGCGATGRLSIQMASIWRDFWQKRRAEGLFSPSPDEWEDRAFSAMAGGDFALIKSVEGFEDFAQFGRKQLSDLGVREGDVVFAITEGGETSFVIGTAWQGLDAGARVFFVYNNPDDVLREKVIRSREVIDEPRIEKINLTTGPMAITGSTRMQATSIQICVMITLFEMALRHIFREIAPGSAESGRDPAAVPAEFLKALEATHSELSSHGLREQMAGILAMEEAVYRTGRKNCYFADALAIDVLTDTTERSPTFCIPAFRKFDDLRASESWSFLFMPSETSEKAWERLLKRAPRAVEWTEDEVRDLIGPELAPKQHAIMKDIGLKEILRFKIGLDGMRHRPFNAGDTATAIVTAEEMDSLTQPDGFYRRQIEDAARAGARTGVIFAGDADEAAKAEEFVGGWDAGVTPVFLKLPRTDSFLSFAPRIGVKMLLNALSTCTMVRLGRVLGNVMIWVVPSNLKLIDRSTRYISQLSGTPYDDSCRMLFEAIEYVAPRVQAGQAYPSPVGVSVMRLRHGLSSEEAEKRLYQELES
jgi:N-acetylmuramic acid 6-phosphate etherase